MDKPSVTVIGTGALGTTLAKAFYENGYPIVGLFNRRYRKAKVLASAVDTEYISEFPESMKELGSIIFLTVQDSEISDTVHNLSMISDNFTGYIVVHCSGSESADILKPVKQKGAEIAAFHPLQTFTARSTPKDFKNIFFDLEADEGTARIFQKIAATLGGETLQITAEAKPFLHAAAVFASNYMVTLLDASGKIAGLGGMNSDKALKALLPLVNKSLQNIESENNTLKALSGPIKRGDIETVRKHLQLLRQDDDLFTLYKKLGLQTLEIASKSQKFSKKKHAELYSLLK